VPLAGIGAVLLLAFGMKAAAFPVNAWLPASYHAPPPAISALLAGLLTKVGVYALLRSLVGMLLPGARELLDPVTRARRHRYAAGGAARRYRRDEPAGGRSALC
jgi:formate hydrogenlyase subunit 3/multisubunit Na+/H+ antiporter MnhD subunit